MYQNASTQRRGFPQIRTLNWVLHHFMFTWPPDKSPFLSWKTLHFNTENCANGFYIASQLLIHFIFPTWQGWLQVVKLCNHLFFFARLWLGTIALKLLGWEACLRTKGTQGKRFVVWTSQMWLCISYVMRRDMKSSSRHQQGNELKWICPFQWPIHHHVR